MVNSWQPHQFELLNNYLNKSVLIYNATLKEALDRLDQAHSTEEWQNLRKAKIRIS